MIKYISEIDVEFPKNVKISEEGKDFIRKLLHKDPIKRLGAAKGLEEIKEHPWFKNFSFEELK